MKILVSDSIGHSWSKTFRSLLYLLFFSEKKNLLHLLYLSWNGKESFGWILLNSKFICVIGTVPTYLGNWGEKVNFDNSVAEIQQKYEREREKVEERECMNFGNGITEIPATRSACPSVCAMCSKWDVLKKKKKPIMAIPLPKFNKSWREKDKKLEREIFYFWQWYCCNFFCPYLLPRWVLEVWMRVRKTKWCGKIKIWQLW